MTPPDLNLTRGEKWHYVIGSLLGGLDDDGILKWLDTHGGDLDQMFEDAVRLRGGMIAT